MAINKTFLEEEEEEKRGQTASEQTDWAAKGLRPASEQKETTAPLVVRMDKQNNESAVNVASRIPSEDERNNFLETYRDQISSKKSPNYQAYVPTLKELNERVGERTTGRTANMQSMGALAGFGLFDVNGNDINVNTASPQMIVQGIQGIGDTDKRKQAAKIFTTLTQTKGSRFYGFTTDADLNAFRDSAEMTLTGEGGYNDIIDGYRQSFYAGEGHEAENEEAYRLAYEQIQTETSGFVRRLLTDGLNQVYREITYAESTPKAGEPESEGEGEEPKQEAPETAEEAEQPESGLTPAQSLSAMGIFMEQTGAGSYVPDGFAAPEGAEAPVQRGTLPTITTQDAGDVVALMKQGRYDMIDPNDPNRAYVEELYQDANVRKLNGVLSDEANAEVEAGNVGAEYEQTLSLGSFGTTIQLAYQTIHAQDFPQELYGDCMMILNEVVRDAGKAIERGEIATDPTAENAFEAYLKAHPEQMEKVKSIEEAQNALIANQNELRTQQQQKTEQSIRDARTAILNGSASDEQWALYRENVSADTREVAEAMADSALWMDVSSFGGDFWTGGGYANSSIKAGLDAAGIVSYDTGFMQSLRGEMHALLQEDTEMAVSLGMTADEYHQFIGGMSADQLASRAYLRMQEQGASITPEELETLSGGAGVGVLQTVGYGVSRGAQSLVSSYADSLYMGMTLADVERQGAENRNYYQRTFGTFGADFYRRDLQRMIDSGELDESFASALKQAMNETQDIFDIGIDPQANGFLLSTGSQMRRGVERLDTQMTQNATPGEYKWYQRVSSMTENAGQAAIATAGTLATGSAGIGFALGYDIPGWGRSYTQRLDEGYSLSSAAHMASYDTAASHLANSGTFSKIFGRMTGATTLERAGWFDAMQKNPSGAAKALAAVRTFVLAAGGNIVDEAVTDEMKENLAAQATDAVFGPIYRKIDAGESVGAGDVIAILADAPKNISVTGAAKEVAANFTEAAITTSLFALAGASGETFQSVKKAKEITSGKSSDIQGFTEAVAEDAQNPEFIEAVNREAKAQQLDERTVQVLAMDDGKDGKMAAAQKTQEQADSHKAEVNASSARMENAKNAYYERKEAGDIDAANAALMDFAKGKQGLEEHTREAEQKDYEAKQIRESKMQDARLQASKEIAQEAREERVSLQNSADVRTSQKQQRIARIDKFIEDVNAILADDPDAELTEDQMKTLQSAYEERARLEEEIEAIQHPVNRQAAGDARAEADKLLDAQRASQNEELAAQMRREAAQAEADEMLPVYQTLARTRVYVDDSQKANILSATDLKSLSQVNRKFGLKLTGDKNDISLDGSFFADLAGLAPGRIDAQADHPEDALMEIVNRKKELKGMQASVGETAYEKYLPDGAFYGTTDPVMQQTASEIYKATGIEVVVAPLAQNVRALYDRENGRIILSNRIGAGEAMRKAAMHELTHYIEGSAGYEAYKKAVLEAAYLGDKDGTLRKADEERIKATYEDSGIELDQEGIEKELVAEATEKIVNDRNGDIVSRLLSQSKRGVIARVQQKLGQFLAHAKAKKEGTLDQYEAIEAAYDRLTEALQKKGKWQPGEGGADPTIDMDTTKRKRGEVAYGAQGEQMQFALVDVGEMGKGVYESNFEDGTPKDVKRQRTIQLWQNVWSQQPIELTIEEDGQPRQITANFDPDYDPQNIRRTDLGKMMHSKNGSAGDRNVTLNLADDLYDIARTSDYHSSEAEQGKTGDTHKGVKIWHYFFKDIIYRDGEKETPYTVWMDVKEKNDGGYVYQLYARKTKEKTQPSQSREIGPGDLSATSSSDTSIADDEANVNPYVMPEDVKYALAPNQFGNETAQRLTTIGEEVKEILKDSRHERIGNQQQLDSAWDAVNARGLDTVADELLGKEGTWDAQDNVTAALCMILAEQNGDLSTETALAMRYDREGSKQGQTLQSRKVLSRLTPQGAMAEAVRKADRANAKKGLPAGGIPTGEGAPKKVVNTQNEKGKTKKTHKIFSSIYEAADGLKKLLDQLPGNISYDNPWNLPLSDKQMELIRKYQLTGEKLPGARYNTATLKQRMLSAIIAMGNEVDGDGLTTLCQQLEAMKQKIAVVTKADLNYIASQTAEFKAIEGNDAAQPKTQAGKEALSRAFQAQDNTIQATGMQKWSSERFMNMLSAPATAVRNISSNIIGGGLEDVSTRIAERFDKGLEKKTGNRTTASATREERRAGKDAFAQEVAQTVTDYFVTGADTSHSHRYEAGGQGRVFQTEWVEACRNFVDFTMQIGDRPFYEQTYAEELAVVKRLGMKKTEQGENGETITRAMTEDEMVQEATARALKRVYQEDSAVVDVINRLRATSPEADLFISTLMPFVKTPMNVAMRAVEYSPVGLASALVRRAAFGIDSGKAHSISQRDYVMAMGRGLTGSGLLAAGAALAAAGIIGFGREDEENAKRREVQNALGEPYGMYIEIFGTKHEIDWALPMSSAVATGAELFKAFDDGEGLADAAFGAIMSGIGDQVMSTPMLSAMQDIFRGYDDTEGMVTRLAKTGAESLINQTLSPAVIRAIAKATDPYVRDTSSQSYVWSTLCGSVIQYWPGLRQMLPIKTDLTGDLTRQNGYWNQPEHQSRALQMLDSFFTPTATIGEKNDEALLELLELSYAESDTSCLPAALVSKNAYSLTLNKSTAKSMRGFAQYAQSGMAMELTDDEKRQINADYGNLLFNGDGGRSYRDEKGNAEAFPGLRAIMNDEAKLKGQKKLWSRMDNAERVELVSKMTARAKTLIIMDEARKRKE